MCGPDEVVHVTVPAGHTRRRSHRVAPQYVDGIVQTLQTVLDTTLLQSEEMKRGMRNMLEFSFRRNSECSSSSDVVWMTEKTQDVLISVIH